MQYDERQILYQDYTAEMLGMLVRTMTGFGGKQIEIPSFYELAYPDHVDNRSAAEIKAHILAMLD